jgi:hypothetical protein
VSPRVFLLPEKNVGGNPKKEGKDEDARMEKKKQEEKRKDREEMKLQSHLMMMRQRREYEHLNRESRKVTWLGSMCEEEEEQVEEEKERPCKFPRWTQTTKEDKVEEDKNKKTSKVSCWTQ